MPSERVNGSQGRGMLFRERDPGIGFQRIGGQDPPTPKRTQSGCKGPVARVGLEAVGRGQGLYRTGEAGGNKQGDDVRTEQDAAGWMEGTGFVFQAPFAGCDVGGDISIVFGTDGLAPLRQSACWKPGWR